MNGRVRKGREGQREGQRDEGKGNVGQKDKGKGRTER